MGKGGMRLGAGRPSYKVKAEQLRRLDISRWQREGYLRAGNAFGWCWRSDGVQTGTIGVQVHNADALYLLYSIGEDQRDGTQRIRIDRTPCHFGSTRAWFACPRCNRRSRVLYMRWGRFACRCCQQVSYTSQSSDEMGRTWLKQQKLEAKLGDDWQRPKGMRLQTYDALLDRLEDCQRQRDEAFARVAMRLFGTVSIRKLLNQP